MTDQSPNAQPDPEVPGLPPAMAGIVDRVAHQLAGALVVILVSHGWVTKDHASADVQIFASGALVVFGVMLAWAKSLRERKRLAAALNAPPPQVPVKP